MLHKKQFNFNTNSLVDLILCFLEWKLCNSGDKTFDITAFKTPPNSKISPCFVFGHACMTCSCYYAATLWLLLISRQPVEKRGAEVTLHRLRLIMMDHKAPVPATAEGHSRDAAAAREREKLQNICTFAVGNVLRRARESLLSFQTSYFKKRKSKNIQEQHKTLIFSPHNARFKITII